MNYAGEELYLDICDDVITPVQQHIPLGQYEVQKEYETVMGIST